MRWATFRDHAGATRVGVVAEDEILALEPGETLLGPSSG